MEKINVWELQDYKDKELRNTIGCWNKEKYSLMTIFFENITDNERGYYIFNTGKISVSTSKTRNRIVSKEEGKLLTFSKAKG